MLKIVYSRDRDEHAVLIRGHAEFAPIGRDIVCAAVSAILQAALLGFKAIAKEYPAHVSYEEHDAKS